eukprot:scaffold4777_cov256-Chaetoceros_neogracile.AAC.11
MKCYYSLILASLTISPETVAFSPVSFISSKPVQGSSRTRLFSIFDDEKSNSSDNDFEGFNPFNRKETISAQRAPQILSSTISLRQLRMKDVVSALLNADESKYEQILLANEELIMEPLLDDDAVMDEDSIYDVGMTREERFDRYEKRMLGREEEAFNRNVKKILGTMREFVLSRRPQV